MAIIILKNLFKINRNNYKHQIRNDRLMKPALLFVYSERIWQGEEIWEERQRGKVQIGEERRG